MYAALERANAKKFRAQLEVFLEHQPGVWETCKYFALFLKDFAAYRLSIRDYFELGFFKIRDAAEKKTWDVTVDQDDHIICIEYNLRQPGSVVYQFANGPLAGEHTDAFLGFLKRDKERARLPISIRCR